jgi:hypothetical protein
LQAWLQSGVQVAAPPKDYHCILNESLWFNRHLSYPYANKNCRPFGKPIEDRLIRCGFTHICDLLSSTAGTSNELKFISLDKAQERTGSQMLAGIVHKIIYQIIPFVWLMIINRKIREPFQSGDWSIEKSATAALRPTTIYRVRNITQSLMLFEAYVFTEIATGKLRTSMPGSVKLIPISQAIKACVIKDQECQFFYCGNYSTFKLLLSRLSLTDANSRRFTCFNYSVKSVYQAVMEIKGKIIPAVVR